MSADHAHYTLNMNTDKASYSRVELRREDFRIKSFGFRGDLDDFGRFHRSQILLYQSSANFLRYYVVNGGVMEYFEK